MTPPILHGYWRSSAAYRVRIALNFKRIDYGQITHDLRTGAQRGRDYLALAPQGLVPALAIDEIVLTQSNAILEWIEENFPTPRLLPPDTHGRAIVRSMAAVVGCDIHPINNLRVLNLLRQDFVAQEDQVRRWIAHWISLGFDALEQFTRHYSDGFAYGSEPTFVDCYLIPQLYVAERFGVDLSPYPTIRAIGEQANKLVAFQAAHPALQPDADTV
jgi:maleylpyruvate isomerase